MKKIYEDANDQHVTAVVAYADSTDNKLYDKATGADKNRGTAEEAENWFTKNRLLIDVDGELCRPITFSGNVVVTANVGESTTSFNSWEVAAE